MGEQLTAREKEAFKPPTKIPPSVWAETYRFLPPTVAAEPGKYRNSRTPYIAGIIDTVMEPGVEEIVLCKAAQLGFTTAIQNLIGWSIDVEPAPALLVMPSQDEARKVVTENIIPLIDTCPQVKAHLLTQRDSLTKEQIQFDSMSLYLGWAGSPQSLARRAVRFVYLDEVDKYPSFAGKDADPISLAKARARTYLHRKKIIIGSTPTVRTGAIWRAYEDCPEKRHYHVPCPHCSKMQRLVWDQVKWENVEEENRHKKAERIELNRLAYYECIECKGKIEDKHKPAMLVNGKWVSEGITKSARVGFHISAIYSPWVSFSALAAQWQRSIGNAGAMQEFKNQWLAEPFEELISLPKVEDLQQNISPTANIGIVPLWAGCVLLSADTQKDRFYWTLVAWGAEFKSQLIDYGVAGKFEDLQKILDTQYPVEGTQDFISPMLCFIDSGGDRTGEIYNYTLTDQTRIYPIKGSATKPKQIVTLSKVTDGIILRLIDTEYCKDELDRLRNIPGRFTLPAAVTDDFLTQITNEVKIFDRKANRNIWTLKSSGAANHYFDCLTYNLAAAIEAGVGSMLTEQQLAEQRQLKAQAEQARQPNVNKTKRSGWLKPSGKGNGIRWLR